MKFTRVCCLLAVSTVLSVQGVSVVNNTCVKIKLASFDKYWVEPVMTIPFFTTLAAILFGHHHHAHVDIMNIIKTGSFNTGNNKMLLQFIDHEYGHVIQTICEMRIQKRDKGLFGFDLMPHATGTYRDLVALTIKPFGGVNTKDFNIMVSAMSVTINNATCRFDNLTDETILDFAENDKGGIKFMRKQEEKFPSKL